MNNNEMELIWLIREHEDPKRALQFAMEVILTYLKQHGSSAQQGLVVPSEFDGIN